MKNIKPKSEDSTGKPSNQEKEARNRQSKEYHNFIDTMTSVVEKYGIEILKEIDSAVWFHTAHYIDIFICSPSKKGGFIYEKKWNEMCFISPC